MATSILILVHFLPFAHSLSISGATILIKFVNFLLHPLQNMGVSIIVQLALDQYEC